MYSVGHPGKMENLVGYLAAFTQETRKKTKKLNLSRQLKGSTCS
jgi:hypothetical protein